MQDCEQLFDENTFYPTFLSDLQAARGLVLIASPYLTTRQIARFQKMLQQCIARGVRVCVLAQEDRHWQQRKVLPSQRLQDTEAAMEKLTSIGVHVTLRSRMHEKVVIIDEDLIWKGSMNVLSHFDTTERMERERSRDKVMQAILKHRLDSCSVCRESSGLSLMQENVEQLLIRIGARMAAERNKFGWSQNDVARKTGIGQSVISEVEHGKRNVEIRTLIRVMSALRLTLCAVPWILEHSLDSLMLNSQEPSASETSVDDQLRYLGACIAYRRRKFGLSQKQVATSSGIGQTGISQLECGKRNISLDSLNCILGQLNLSPCVLPLHIAERLHGPIDQLYGETIDWGRQPENRASSISNRFA